MHTKVLRTTAPSPGIERTKGHEVQGNCEQRDCTEVLPLVVTKDTPVDRAITGYSVHYICPISRKVLLNLEGGGNHYYVRLSPAKPNDEGDDCDDFEGRIIVWIKALQRAVEHS